jgi:hypothetical protein
MDIQIFSVSEVRKSSSRRGREVGGGGGARGGGFEAISRQLTHTWGVQ